MKKVASLSILLLLFTGSAQSQNWQQVFGPFGGDVEALASDAGHVYAGTDSGIYVSVDNGANWTEKNNGLSVEEIFSIAITNAGTVLVGTEGGGIFRSTNFGDSWVSASDGLPPNSNILSLASDSRGNIFAGHAGAGVYYSSDDGEHWRQRSAGMPDSTVYSLTISPSGSVYAGVTRATLGSLDQGLHWTVLDSIFPKGDEVLALAADSSDVIYEGTFRGIRRYTHSANWTQWTDVTPPFVSSDDEFKALATYHNYLIAGFFGNGVERSTDRGATWRSMGAGLTDDQIYSLTITPSGYLFAGTFLAEVFRIDLLAASVDPEASTSAHIKAWPQPFDAWTRIQLPSSDGQPTAISIYDAAAVCLKRIPHPQWEDVTKSAVLDLSDLPSGLYFAVIQTPGGVRSVRLVRE